MPTTLPASAPFQTGEKAARLAKEAACPALRQLRPSVIATAQLPLSAVVTRLLSWAPTTALMTRTWDPRRKCATRRAG